jgi:poly(hydroxyalkanoate) depolymerase family esterase
MAGLRKTFSHLGGLRRRFETLLARARKIPAAAFTHPPSRLQEIANFGANPGNLRMLAYVPDRLPPRPALVVALHGCTQTAAGFDLGTGWSMLADRLGFVVIYPEQQAPNNPHKCFSWFLPDDTARERGEALSIREMVERATVDFSVDRRRVFVTGLSAGGAMASVMLATYPEVFAGGAIIAGLPYGCASSVEEAFAAMFQERAASARALGDRVRDASRHRGPWPKVSVWHGSADPLVKPSNAEDIARQWANVHGLSGGPSHEEAVNGHIRRIWQDAGGNTIIEVISITGMAHGVPLATGKGDESCGALGPFFLDVGISSTNHIARFWGLFVEAKAWSSAAKKVSPAIGAGLRETEVITNSGRASLAPTVAHVESNETHSRRRHLDANAVIAAAFEAAGLPTPETTNQQPGTVLPGPIITAALKAAGLVRR